MTRRPTTVSSAGEGIAINPLSAGADTDKQLNSKIDLFKQKLNTSDTVVTDMKSTIQAQASGEIKKQVVPFNDQTNPMKYESSNIGTIDRPRSQSPSPVTPGLESQTATALLLSRSRSPSNPNTVEGGGNVLQPRLRAKSPTPGAPIIISEKTAAGIAAAGLSTSVNKNITSVNSNVSGFAGNVPSSISPRAVLESPTSPTFVTTSLSKPFSTAATDATKSVGDKLRDTSNGVSEIRSAESNGSQGSIIANGKYVNSQLKRYDSKTALPISPSHSGHLGDKQSSPSLLVQPRSVKSMVGEYSDSVTAKKDTLGFLSDRSETMSEEQSQNDNNSVHSDGSRVRNKTTTSERYQAYLKEKKMKRDRDSTGSNGASPPRENGASSPRGGSNNGSPKHPPNVKNMVGKWNEIIPAGTAKSNGYKDRNSEGTVKAEKKYSTF